MGCRIKSGREVPTRCVRDFVIVVKSPLFDRVPFRTFSGNFQTMWSAEHPYRSVLKVGKYWPTFRTEAAVDLPPHYLSTQNIWLG